MSTERRVRKLRIRTDDRATLPRINFLLEDALRTASLPGIPANGQVFIKKLNLGSFFPSVNSRFLSKRIDDLMRHLTLVKVDRAAAEQPKASAVWFADELEPYRLLADMLAQGHRPQAWYWSIAVNGWSPQLPVSQGISQIISQVSQKEAGLTGLAYVLEPLLKGEVLLNVLHTVASKDVIIWLLTLGLKTKFDQTVSGGNIRQETDKSGAVETHFRHRTMPGNWQNALNKALSLWRPNDPRSIFIASLGLAQGRHEVTSGYVAEAIRDALGQIGAVQHLLLDGVQDQQLDSSADHIALEKQSHPIVEPNFDGGHLYQNHRSTKKSGGRIKKFSKKSSGKKEEVNYSDDQYVSTDQTINKQLPSPQQSFLVGRFAGELSNFAGLPFLITVLERLGYEKLLLEQPEYLSLQMAERIFWQVSALLKIPEVDPILGFLNEPSEIASTTVEFVAPMQWRSILKPSKADVLKLSLAPVAGLPGQRLIMDQKERLVLGLWHSGNKAQVQPWLDSPILLRTLDRARTWNIAKAVDNFVRAIGRYLRCNTRMNLRTLIQRQAYVAITRTHLDITTHLQQLDIRVRSAGLDIDPGWVSWLGRVVQFHYIENEG